MPIYANTLQVSFLGYAAIFACIGVGFFFVKKVHGKEFGAGFWAMAFSLNAVGFIFWSGIAPIKTWQYFLIGEIFHYLGFNILLYGIYRFAGYPFRRWNVAFFVAVSSLWLSALISFTSNPVESTIFLRVIRSFLFISAGVVVLFRMPKLEIAGRRTAGTSLILWGAYNLAYGYIRYDPIVDFIFGLLPGFQILAAFGLIAMIIDRIRLHAEASDRRVSQLEKLLPTCSYCRRIRGKDNNWHNIETYIEKQTSVQFSHGICPDCLEKTFPEYAKKKRETPEST